MQLNRHWVHHQRDGQSMTGYLVSPARIRDPLPAILVIQEIWGPDAHIQDVADRFATAGYVALAPDLYSRGGRPESLAPERISELKSFMDTVPPGAWADPHVMQQSMTKEPSEKAARLQETMGTLFGSRDHDGMVQDLMAWVDYLASAPETHGQPVGSTGYCMGGQLSFELATRDIRLQVALVYYGSAPEPAKMEAIRCPVYGFYGEHDPRITGAVPGVAQAMQERGKAFEYQIYNGAGHAFFNDSRRSYNIAAARDAWAKTLGIFRTRIG